MKKVIIWSFIINAIVAIVCIILAKKLGFFSNPDDAVNESFITVVAKISVCAIYFIIISLFVYWYFDAKSKSKKELIGNIVGRDSRIQNAAVPVINDNVNATVFLELSNEIHLLLIRTIDGNIYECICSLKEYETLEDGTAITLIVDTRESGKVYYYKKWLIFGKDINTSCYSWGVFLF